MPQVQFVCDSCGSKKLAIVVVDLTRYSTIESIADYGPPTDDPGDLSGIIPTTSGFSMTAGKKDGYECPVCHTRVPAATHEELFAWLKDRNMLSDEWID